MRTLFNGPPRPRSATPPGGGIAIADTRHLRRGGDRPVDVHPLFCLPSNVAMTDSIQSEGYPRIMSRSECIVPIRPVSAPPTTQASTE